MMKVFILIIGVSILAPSLSSAQSASLNEYTNFLEQALQQEVNEDATADFYKQSFAYWMANKVDYNDNPAKYTYVMELYHQGRDRYIRDRTIAIDRFESTIESYRRFDARNKLPASPILFVGSSSIVFWETSKSFPGLPVVNRGFGGASLPEIIHYYDDVVKKHNPSMMIVYCDIDVENGRSPEFSANAFKELIDKVKADFPMTPVLLISMKPTLIDDVLGKEVRANKLKTNKKLIEYANSDENLHYIDISSPMLREDGSLKSEIFLDDGMHLNPLGYELWDPLMRAEINRIRGQ